MNKKLNKHHKKLLSRIKQYAATKPFKTKLSDKYDGHNDISYPVSNPQIREIVKTWLKENKNITFEEYIDLLNSIYTQSSSSTEKYLGGYLLGHMPKFKKNIDPKLLDTWLENLTGWAQIDSLCQSCFDSDDLLNNWKIWKELLENFNNSKNIGKKRASLVLLTNAVRKSGDARLVALALNNIDNLKHEKDILITKAISWLLRSMVKLHKDTVKNYVQQNIDTLPKIAVRETTRKIATGRK